MAKVDFSNSSVQAFGLPQSCVTCGNDEDNQLVAQALAKPYGYMHGCLLFLLILGPLGWLLGLLLSRASSRKKAAIQLPVCKLCNQGLAHLRLRASIALALAGCGLMAAMAGHLPGRGYGLLACALVALYGLIEYACLSPQFVIRVLKMDDNGVSVQLPNEDYPCLYQRHLDNALLYGSSDTLGSDATAS
jgi:hypothetical protein